ncbi:2-methylcitrate dehydratase PrpD [Lentibacillus halodurans]|uniref:2-methylcitrate dehydratase PrpD n=1 Tax=Lentibacillus halodurans TaxID=237679 RepID=A0A1I0YAL4_9BACI|nr:MmgE/PrpD family protein [Lentibacillus halodurans]SFB10311.1 2-methylcitrate dehydratase PrpD [Lentibacillus halodurans]
MTITETLADYYVDLDYASLPENVIQEAKLCLLDSLGCMLAGAQTEEIRNLSVEMGQSTDDHLVSLIGLNQKSSLLYAAIINGSMAHAQEMDDVHKEAKSHAGAVVVPTVLTYGDYLRSTGKDILTSIIVGYDTMLRIGKGINATKHRMKGWHATGTCGTFGAAASIAKLSGLTKQQMVDALGLAGTQSSALWAFTSNGANSKMFHAGSASASGLLATLLVNGGLTGANQIIEAEDGGFYRSSSEDYSYDTVVKDLGEDLLIDNITRKPFSCCRSMHPSIDAALKLRQSIDPNDIESIKVYTYEVAKVQCGFTNTPKNTSDAKFSIPYGVAVALIDGQALMSQFTPERITDEETLCLAQKVEIIVDEEFENVYPQNWGCRLEIKTSNESYSEVIQDAKGDPANPLTQDEIEKKFIYLSKGLIGESNTLEIIQKINHLEKLDDISKLVELCLSCHTKQNNLVGG